MRGLNRLQSSPTRRPDYRVTVAGRTVSPELDARLVSLTLVDRRGMEADQLDITLSDHDGRLQLPDRGALLQLALGWHGSGLVDRGSFTVDEVEHSGPPDQLTIRARSADMLGALPGKRSESWHERTLGEIVGSIAARQGLQAKVAPALAGTLIPHIDQTAESDLNFLTRLGERFDAVAAVKADALLLFPAGEAATVSGLAISPVRIRRQDGDAHSYSLTERNSASGVKAYWHDTGNAKREEVLVGSDDKPKVLREPYPRESDALAAARGEWQRIQRAGAELTLNLAVAQPALYPETPALLEGWTREIVEQDWIVTEVTHSLTDTAYTMALRLELVRASE